jgi:dipeptidyl aminopeptidase/acylaminoacyl peptidase
MKTLFKAISVLACALLISSCDEKGGKVSKTEFIPRKVLFGNPDKIMVRLSPDGKYMAHLAPLDGVMNIFVADAKDPSSAKPITFDKGRGIQGYSWTYRGDELIYSQDTDGDENSILYLVNLKDKESKAITSKGTKSYITGISESKPDEILISSNERDPHYFDIYKYNLKTGAKEMVYKNQAGYIGFITDENLNLRFSTKTLPNGDQQIDQFIDGKPQLFKLIKFDDTSTSGAIGINKLGTKLYMEDSEGRDKAALYEIDLKAGTRKIIAESDVADISDVDIDPKTHEIQAYTYNYDRPVTVIIDPAIKEDFEYLGKVEHGEMDVVSRTLKDDLWIVAYKKDNAPISYYIYDRAKKKADFLFVHNSKLAGYKLNEMIPVVIKSKDGLDLVSYLSVPQEYKADANDPVKLSQPLPLILDVHGGPQARDAWGYDPFHQWLTNRGYAVLSVNYRGSSGFGKGFIRAGDGEWAAKMHDDLIDAVNWAISKGITTKDKVAISGGSYGGYATLVGLTMTPDVFACGIDLVGPSNLTTLYNSIPPYWEPFRANLRRMLGGNPETKEGKEILAKKSPLTYYDKITKPLLIAQGANDPRVKQAESDQIVNKMVENSIPVTYLLYPNEGHGFARPENRASFYAVAEQFLGKCFNKPTEPIGTDLKDSSMQVLHGSEIVGTTSQN